MKVLLENVGDVIFNGRVEEPRKYGDRAYTNYFLNLDLGYSLGSVPCTKEVYDKCENLEKYSNITFAGDFDTNYKSFRISAVQAVK